MLSRASLPSVRVATRSTISRSPLPLRRGVHFDNAVYNNTPFNYKNKAAFTAKYFAIMTTLFATPFIAVGYQLRKKQGGSAP